MPSSDKPTETGSGPAQGFRDAATIPPSYQDTGDDPAGVAKGSAATTFASSAEFSAALVDIGLINHAELDAFAALSTDGVLSLSRALIQAQTPLMDVLK
jgi:hypothetical protein